MLLAIDVGNTNITIGVFQKEDLAANFRLTTKIARTSDEYGLLLCDLLRTRGIDPNCLEDVIIASVVPGMMYSFTSGITKYIHKMELFSRELQLQEFKLVQMHFGGIQQSFLKLKFASQIQFWQGIQSAVCRQVWYLAALDRQNILSSESKKKQSFQR